MTLKEKEENLRFKLIEKLAELDLPSFMFNELIKILKILNYYKLKNLENNRNNFEKFLKKLTRNYTNQLVKNI